MVSALIDASVSLVEPGVESNTHLSHLYKNDYSFKPYLNVLSKRCSSALLFLLYIGFVKSRYIQVNLYKTTEVSQRTLVN